MRYPVDLRAATIRIPGGGGDEIEAYLATPLLDGPQPGVLVIHHAPGWDESTKEIVRRFASHGYAAICPHLYSRAGADLSPDDAAAAVRAAGGNRDEQFLGDAQASIAHLRALPGASGKVGVIGYCSGGRQAFLTACSLPVDAAVDCYGGYVSRSAPADRAPHMVALLARAGDLGCPLLGLFGAEDRSPTVEDTEVLAEALRAAGKPFDFHTFEGAGHAFFSVDRQVYRVEAANQGWELIWQWFGRHLREAAPVSGS